MLQNTENTPCLIKKATPNRRDSRLNINKLRFFIINFVFFCAISYTNTVYGQSFSDKIIENTKLAVVTIKVTSSLNTEFMPGNAWEGTGFIVNKKKGLILTNAHVSGRAMIGKHDLVFQDGTQLDAKVVYYDPWLDYAFLKTDPSKIPSSAKEIKISKKDPVQNEKILIIGNNEGKSFSIHTGNVSGLFEVVGTLPQHSIRLSLNTKGGSSGSPIVNLKGEAIALNFAGDNVFALGIHPQYLRHALKYIEQDKVPLRKHVGVVSTLYPLSQAIKHRGIKKDILTRYMKQFPKSRSSILQVVQTLKGSPADGNLLNGDILWAINGKIIGPKLINLDDELNNIKSDKVKLTIIRENKFMDLMIDLYNLEDNKSVKMIKFNKGVVFEMDDIMSYQSGGKAKTITFNHPEIRALLKLEKINGITINSLEDIKQIIPSLIKEKYFYIDIKHYTPIPLGFANYFNYSQPSMKVDIFYDSLDDPKEYIFNTKTYDWEGKLIGS